MHTDVFPTFCSEFKPERARTSLFMHLRDLLTWGVQGGVMHIDVFPNFRSNLNILKPLEVNETENRLVRGLRLAQKEWKTSMCMTPPLHTSWSLSRGQDDQSQLTSQITTHLPWKSLALSQHPWSWSQSWLRWWAWWLREGRSCWRCWWWCHGKWKSPWTTHMFAFRLTCCAPTCLQLKLTDSEDHEKYLESSKQNWPEFPLVRMG